jgi:hypothetical protein
MNGHNLRSRYNSMDFSISRRGIAKFIFKRGRKIIGGRETITISDLRNTQGGIFQHGFGLFQTKITDVVTYTQSQDSLNLSV